MLEPKPRSTNYPGLLLIALLAVAVYLVVARLKGPDHGGLKPGNALPTIAAAGWINGEPLSNDQLKRKVVVIDAWASWCLPCREETKHLVELQKAFADNPDVVFLGITGQSAEEIPQMQSFIENLHVPWPNGYGAVETLDALQVKYIPCVWVVDRQGLIIWNRDSSEPIEDAIRRAL